MKQNISSIDYLINEAVASNELKMVWLLSANLIAKNIQNYLKENK